MGQALIKVVFTVFSSEPFRKIDGYNEIFKSKTLFSHQKKECFTPKRSVVYIIEKASTLR